ncbi:Crp/Fnr family transcriptional regulator [Variovorax sp. ZS18.2.2]|uniref:Crp/Fnr family transcriptional regulator n=1 Tax=Variovorax sp. ZS18.2.2 TaxID=2971255 RepID=UPI002151D960|nr:Crp/Fnr family transcriptional regulator [Variovorax sp. ZS18.2.2]MCR6479896.1 Crp/Fnr family transcriptional regulator [Variovorax sp. ZS18.2.2]
MAKTEPRLSDKELMERTLRDMPAFATWSSLSMSRLMASSRLQWHARGDSLSDKNRAPEVLVLVSGSVLYAEPSAKGIGAGAAWTLLGTGLLLGLPHMVALEDDLFEYFANNDVVAIHIQGNLLFELLDSDPVRWRDLGHMVILQDQKLGDLTSSQMSGRLPRRLAETIEKLAASHGTRSSENSSIHLRLTQHDLAAMLRVSRQSVSKELASLSIAGVIRLKYNGILVLDPVALKKIARPPRVQHATVATPRAGTGENSLAEAAFMERTLRTKQAFLPWSSKAMVRLLRSSRLEKHPSGSVVWTSLSGVEEYILLVSGHTTISRISPEGERFALILFGPGDFTYITPVQSVAEHRGYGAYEQIADTDAVAIHMPMTLVLETLDSEPMLWKEALLMSERQHAVYTQTVYRQVAGSLRQRLASTIHRLAELHGVRAESEGTTRLKVSQASLALLLQANRQAVNKELKALATTGAIELGYNGVTVLDHEALGHIAARSAER